MKYDDAGWHYGGDFPDDLPESAGGTHIAMLVVWCLLNGLAGNAHVLEYAEALEELRTRTLTPGAWFMTNCDGKFIDNDLNEEGNCFVQTYYAAEEGLQTDPGSYIADYELTFPDVPTLYHVPDNWESFDMIAPVIAQRFAVWKERTGRDKGRFLQ